MLRIYITIHVTHMLSVIVTEVWLDLLCNIHTLPFWELHTTINANKIKIIQKKAARFCHNDFSRYSSVYNLIFVHYNREEPVLL